MIKKSVNMITNGFPERIEAIFFTLQYPFLILEKIRLLPFTNRYDDNLIVTRQTTNACNLRTDCSYARSIVSNGGSVASPPLKATHHAIKNAHLTWNRSSKGRCAGCCLVHLNNLLKHIKLNTHAKTKITLGLLCFSLRG